MMTLVGLGLLFVFGFFAVRHFRNGRYVFGVFAAFGSLLGAASLWVSYQVATTPSGSGQDAASNSVAQAPADNAGEAKDDVFGSYNPES